MARCDPSRTRGSPPAFGKWVAFSRTRAQARVAGFDGVEVGLEERVDPLCGRPHLRRRRDRTAAAYDRSRYSDEDDPAGSHRRLLEVVIGTVYSAGTMNSRTTAMCCMFVAPLSP